MAFGGSPPGILSWNRLLLIQRLRKASVAGPPAFCSEEIDGVYVFERVMLYQNSEKWN